MKKNIKTKIKSFQIANDNLILSLQFAGVEQSEARPVDEEANAEVLGFNKHQTFMALGRRLKQEEEIALTTELDQKI